MNQTVTLYLLCGKMASGKSTLAKKLSCDHQAVLISEDRLLAGLYPGEIVDVSTYSRFSGRLKESVKDIIIDLLKMDTNVVLDFPGNTVGQRKWLKRLADQASCRHEMHLIDATDSLCKERLKQRVIEFPERSKTDTPEMFDAINQFFEMPEASEQLNIFVHSTA